MLLQQLHCAIPKEKEKHSIIYSVKIRSFSYVYNNIHTAKQKAVTRASEALGVSSTTTSCQQSNQQHQCKQWYVACSYGGSSTMYLDSILVPPSMYQYMVKKVCECVSSGVPPCFKERRSKSPHMRSWQQLVFFNGKALLRLRSSLVAKDVAWWPSFPVSLLYCCCYCCCEFR